MRFLPPPPSDRPTPAEDRSTPVSKLDDIEALPQLDAIVEALALGVHEPDQLAAAYGVLPEDLQRLIQHPRVEKMLLNAQQRLFRDTTTRSRVRVKAQIATEALVAELNRIAIDPQVNEAVRVRAVDVLLRIAGLHSSDVGAIGGYPTADLLDRTDRRPQFTVNIHLGDDTSQVVTITAEKETAGVTIGGGTQNGSGGGGVIEQTAEEVGHEDGATATKAATEARRADERRRSGGKGKEGAGEEDEEAGGRIDEETLAVIHKLLGKARRGEFGSPKLSIETVRRGEPTNGGRLGGKGEPDGAEDDEWEMDGGGGGGGSGGGSGRRRGRTGDSGRSR
jgi:hypothetical protein